MRSDGDDAVKSFYIKRLAADTRGEFVDLWMLRAVKQHFGKEGTVLDLKSFFDAVKPLRAHIVFSSATLAGFVDALAQVASRFNVDMSDD